jgi:hypothetical protein
VAAAAMAAASSRRQRVRADTGNFQALSVYTFSPKAKSKACHIFTEKNRRKGVVQELFQGFFRKNVDRFV